ncbi:MAG: hypothetical protein J2P17_10925 [Mycobacterium sp.]|nr:hypothetical protein [Mycobacterium sp.]
MPTAEKWRVKFTLLATSSTNPPGKRISSQTWATMPTKNSPTMRCRTGSESQFRAVYAPTTMATALTV